MSCSVVYWSEATSEPPKVVRTPSVLNIFTSKCPSRHNGVHFFDIRTSRSGPNPWCFLTFWLRNVLRATTAFIFSTSQLPKVVRSWCVLCILTWKCASPPQHFFDISTSKSGPTLVCFVHFDLETCFAPQRRALFQHLNCQKWSGPGVFCAFSLRNVLRTTTACNFSSLIWPAGSAPAALASLLFDPPKPQIIGKTQCFATFLPFRASAIFFLLTLSLLLFFLLIFLFSLPLPLLCFSPVHIVGSLTSNFLRSSLKLPIYRIIYRYIPTWPMLWGQGASRAVRGDARLRWGQQGAAGCSKRLKLKKSSKELSWEVLNYWMIVFMTEKMNVQIVHH